MKLTYKQNLAANHEDGPCLVLAVPGSGKTTMLLQRINFLSKNIDPSKILSLTFSRTQALDMKERFQSDSSNFMTIHAFCYLIIRNYLKQQNKQVRILENDDRYNKYSLVSDLYFKINGKKISREDLKLFFNHIGFMKNSLMDESYLDQVEIRNVKKIYHAYENFKRDHFFIDFDDMQVLALKLLDNKRLLRSIKRKYKYFQLDEGQDTSYLQFKILEKIIYPENNILIVADDDQSIYSFRAANPEYLLNFPKRYPKSKVLTLDQNFRSQENIVTSSYEFICQNNNRFKKNVFTKNHPKEKVKLTKLKNSEKLYDYIIKNIREDKKTAILYRNNISAINLISFLIRDGKNFSIASQNINFFESKMFEDLIKIVNFSEDFNKVEIFKDIYYKIGSFLTKEMVQGLDYKGVNQDVFDYFYDQDLKDYQVDALLKLEKEFSHIKSLPLSRKFSFIYSHMGYRDYANLISKKYLEETYNKDIFIESMINFIEDLSTIDEIYEKISYVNSLIKLKRPSNLVLSTIHSSKGLEYDDVFVIDLVKNEFPVIGSKDNYYQRIEEERRIFYVAMTRAKENLHLLSLKYRNNKKVYPSKFYLDMKNI